MIKISLASINFLLRQFFSKENSCDKYNDFYKKRLIGKKANVHQLAFRSFNIIKKYQHSIVHLIVREFTTFSIF